MDKINEKKADTNDDKIKNLKVEYFDLLVQEEQITRLKQLKLKTLNELLGQKNS